MSATHHDTIDPHETLSAQEAHEHHVHVTPFWTMFWVFVVLLALTALTVWSSNIHEFWIGNTLITLGPTPHILMALTIAVIKAVLVAAYFMHLKYDKPLNTIIVGATMFAVILFLGFTILDLSSRDVIERKDGVMKMVGGSNDTVKKAREAGKANAANPAHDPAPASNGAHGAAAPAPTGAAEAPKTGGH